MCPNVHVTNTKIKNRKEPLINQDMPLRAFQKVRVDLFEYRGKDYILCVDYYSKFVEIRKLNGKTAKSVQIMLLAIFAMHRIAEEVNADNMPFNSREFKHFAQNNNFKIMTCSTKFSQSNRLAERTVQTVKKLLKKAHDEGKDESIAMLAYRNTNFRLSIFTGTIIV